MYILQTCREMQEGFAELILQTNFSSKASQNFMANGRPGHPVLRLQMEAECVFESGLVKSLSSAGT